MLPLVKVGMPQKEILIPELEKILYSGMISEGEAVYDFEKKFSNHFNLNMNVLSMNSGTAALHASLVLAGISDGDEVITTSMTAEPTNIAILQVGAKVVFADVDIDSGNLSPESIEEKITDKTRAILVVHYAGFPVRLKEISDIAKKFNIILIEDCAHALGAVYNNNSIGTYGDFSIFSFQAIKHMTTIDGGILCFKNNTLEKEAKKFRWFGMEKGVPRTEIDITSIGYKYNMHNVSAVIGSVQLDCINDRLSKHISNGQYFDQEISKISGLGITKFDKEAVPSYWLYTILSDNTDDIQRKLKEIGVLASKLHKPNHLHSIFNTNPHSLPNLDKFYQRMIHIPCGWWINNDNRSLIVETLKKG